jgi:hypothetical protein
MIHEHVFDAPSILLDLFSDLNRTHGHTTYSIERKKIFCRLVINRMATTAPSKTPWYVYVGAGFFIGYFVMPMLKEEQLSEPLEQAVGPDEVGEEFFGAADDLIGEADQIYQPPPLGTVSSIRHSLGQVGKLSGAKLTTQRIYSTANIPGADIAQTRLRGGKFNRPQPAPAPTAGKAPTPAGKVPTPAGKVSTPAGKAPQMPAVSTRGGETILPR